MLGFRESHRFEEAARLPNIRIEGLTVRQPGRALDAPFQASLVVRPEYPTLPIAIARFLSQPGGLNYGQAMAMATILMLVCGLAILFIERLRLPGAGEF